MRHGRKTIKLQRRQDHRDALLSNLVCSLIEHKQIKTTVAGYERARLDDGSTLELNAASAVRVHGRGAVQAVCGSAGGCCAPPSQARVPGRPTAANGPVRRGGTSTLPRVHPSPAHAAGGGPIATVDVSGGTLGARCVGACTLTGPCGP